MLEQLGQTLLETPRVDRQPRVQQIWSTAQIVVNTIYVLLVIAGGVILMSAETLESSYTIKDIAPRLVVAFIAANVSSQVAGLAIGLANALAAALLGHGLTPQAAADTLAQRLDQNLDAGGVLIVLLVLAALVFAVALSIVYVMRMTLTIVLVSAAPILLACHALPQTEGLAFLWWRALAGVLAVQVTQALVFVITLRVLLTPDNGGVLTTDNQGWDLLIVICMLYVLLRIPTWIMRRVMHGGGRGLVGLVVRVMVLRRIVTSPLIRTLAHRARKTPKSGERPRPGPGGGEGS
ncbi:hypothetical protein DP939_25240 [Spongiactinospora rosea]|uniref:Uncharacterized protein n=1 Tax=Spongiactinospora rosea TaxID=2248750 RepID=A0A366LVA9_9ACTN|nr:hypothetical protein [Spongiactinospora rosea]RBQ17254.1 hypothetical protein DP939_25240 [Spongiactinospora rosea]